MKREVRIGILTHERRGSQAMAARNDPRTSTTLLGRLAQSPADQSAWVEFDRRYGPEIARWCRARGLQAADVDEVTQRVLAKVFGQMEHFVYDPSRSFRGWLRTMAENVARDVAQSVRKHGSKGGSEALQRLDDIEAPADLARRLENQYDLELIELATPAVRERVAKHTWEAFQQTALEGRPAAEVARDLAIAVGTVYQAKFSVARMLKEEVSKLEREAMIPRQY
jgi:RNA polymerase sigma-70 factor (ECF subfamily)